MDKLAAMRAFVEIVDRGSLTAAAAALDRSLPAVVRTLAALESDLGARLLRRTTRRMSLTLEGRDYLERCRRILADVEEAERAVGRGLGTPRGEVRMTAPVQFGRMHVAPALTGFLEAHSEVQVDLLLLDRVVNLVDEGLDLALRIGTLPDSSMVAVPLGQMRRVVCASPGRLEADGEPRHPEELSARPCLRFRGTGTHNVWAFTERRRELAVPVSGAFSCNHAVAVAEACAAGLGYGQFLHYQVMPMIAAGALRPVLERFEREPLPVSLVYPEARLVSPRVRALVDWLRDVLPGELPH